MFGGATDYFDGKFARALTSRIKIRERLLIQRLIDSIYRWRHLSCSISRDAIPFWLIAILVGRDLFMAVVALVLQVKGLQPPLKVTYLGKAATFNLLYAFPFLLLALSDTWYGTAAFIFGWAFAVWGVSLYIGTAVGLFPYGGKDHYSSTTHHREPGRSALCHRSHHIFITQKNTNGLLQPASALRVRMGITDYAARRTRRYRLRADAESWREASQQIRSAEKLNRQRAFQKFLRQFPEVVVAINECIGKCTRVD
jgi:cardiolipin synthase